MRFSRPLRLVVRVAALVAALGSASGVAWAGEEDAKTLFASARQLRASGKCEEAITEFRRALEVYPEGLGSLRNIAECEEQLGRYAAARRDWWDLRRAVLLTNEAKYDGWDKDAEAAHGRLANRVARVTINVVGPKLDRIRVVMDGKPLDPRLIGVELERDLGGHAVEAYYGGASPVSEKFTLAEGARQVVTLTLPANAPGEPLHGAPATANHADGPPPSDAKTMRILGIVALGVGTLATGATIASIVVRGNALSSIEKACPGYDDGQPCSEDLRDTYDRGVTASTLANVFGGFAIVGLGAGITLLAVSNASSNASTGTTPAEPAKSASFRLGVAPLVAGAQLGASGRF